MQSVTFFSVGSDGFFSRSLEHHSEDLKAERPSGMGFQHNFAENTGAAGLPVGDWATFAELLLEE